MPVSSSPGPAAAPGRRRVLQPIDDEGRRYIERLVDEHAPPLLGYCRYVLSGDPAAEDALSLTFEAAMRNLDLLRGMPQGQLRAWLKKTAYRESLRQARQRRPDKQSLAGELPEVASPRDEIARLIDAAGASDLMLRAADTFDPQRQQVLALVLHLGHDAIGMNDVAARLGLSYYAAKKSVSRMTEENGYLAQAVVTVYLAENNGAGCGDAARIVAGRPLSPRLRVAVTSHVRACDYCQDTCKRKLPSALGVLGAFPLLTLPPHLRSRILRDVADLQAAMPPPPAGADSGDPRPPAAATAADDSGGPSRPSRRGARLAASAAALVILALAAVLALHPGPASRAAGTSARYPTLGAASGAGESRTVTRPLDVAHFPDPATGPAAAAPALTGGTPPPGTTSGPQTLPPLVTARTPPLVTARTPPLVTARTPPLVTARTPPPVTGQTPPVTGQTPPVPGVSLVHGGAEQLLTGETSYLYAELTGSLTGTPYVVRITDKLHGWTLQECTSGTVCQVTVQSDEASVGWYSAEVDNSADGTIVGDPAQPVTLNWYKPVLTFSADPPSPSAGQPVTLTAAMNLTLTGSQYFVVIDDPRGNQTARCDYGSNCQAPANDSGAYTAELFSNSDPSSALQSVQVNVYWDSGVH